jgi:uncharacterized protein YbjQ (UPF0145 family)
MANKSEELPEAGWYPNYENQNELRYWDGKVWTDQTRPSDGKHNVILITGNEIPGYKVVEILGLCSGTGNTGAMKLFNTSQSRASFEKAENDLAWRALAMRADAVIDIQLAMQANDNGSNQVMLAGTAVKIIAL